MGTPHNIYVGIESYPLRQRHLVALDGVSASECSSEREASDPLLTVGKPAPTVAGYL